MAHGADTLCEAAAMEHEACNVVYVHRAAAEDKLVKRGDFICSALSCTHVNHVGEYISTTGCTALNENIQTLLGMFSEGLLDPSLP